MSGICMVTGRKTMFGKSISHSHVRTSRQFRPNIQRKRFYVPSEKRFVTLTISTKGIKVIDKRGIDSVLAELRAQGVKV